MVLIVVMTMVVILMIIIYKYLLIANKPGTLFIRRIETQRLVARLEIIAVFFFSCHLVLDGLLFIRIFLLFLPYHFNSSCHIFIYSQLF